MVLWGSFICIDPRQTILPDRFKTSSLQFPAAISFSQPHKHQISNFRVLPINSNLFPSSTFLICYFSLTFPNYGAYEPPALRNKLGWRGVKPLEMHKAGGQPTGELKEAGSELEPRLAFSFFSMALFHITVNPIRSISDLGTVKQHLYTDFKGRGKIREQNLRKTICQTRVLTLFLATS